MTRRCPGCAESIPIATKRCPHCGESVSSRRFGAGLAEKPLAHAAARAEAVAPLPVDSRAEGDFGAALAGPRENAAPIAYLGRRGRHPDVLGEVEDKIVEVLPKEGLRFRFVRMGRGDEEPELGGDDLYVTAQVTQYDMGSWFIRFFLTFLSNFFGAGACKLAVRGEVQTASGALPEFECSSQQGMGFFGGFGESLMRANRKVVAKRFARRVAKQLTGRRVLNIEIGEYAWIAVALGLIGVAPILGLATGLIGLVCGAIALRLSLLRSLKKERILSSVACASCILALCANAWFLAFITGTHAQDRPDAPTAAARSRERASRQNRPETQPRGPAVPNPGENLESSSQDPDAVLRNVLAYAEAGDDAKALRELNELIRLRPDCAPAYLARGRLRARDPAGLDEAIADFQKAVDLDPNDPQAYFDRGMARSLKKDVSALADFAKTFDLAPPGSPLRAQVESMLTKAGWMRVGREWVVALEAALELLDADSTIDCYVDIARLGKERREWDIFQQAIEKGLARFKEETAIWSDLVSGTPFHLTAAGRLELDRVDEDPAFSGPPQDPRKAPLEVVGFRKTDKVTGFVKPVSHPPHVAAEFEEPGGEHFFAIVKIRIPASAVFTGKKKLPYSEQAEGYVYEFPLDEIVLLDGQGMPLGVPIFDEARCGAGCAGEIGDGSVFRQDPPAGGAEQHLIFEQGLVVAVRHVDGAGNELERRFEERGRGVARVLLKLIQEADAIEQEFVFRLARGHVAASVRFRDWATVPLPAAEKVEEGPSAGNSEGADRPGACRVLDQRYASAVVGFCAPALESTHRATFEQSEESDHQFFVIRMRFAGSALAVSPDAVQKELRGEGSLYSIDLADVRLFDENERPLGHYLFTGGGLAGCPVQVGEIDDQVMSRFPEGEATFIQGWDAEGIPYTVLKAPGVVHLAVSSTKTGEQNVRRLVLDVAQPLDTIEMELIFRLKKGEVPATLRFRQETPIPVRS